MYHVRMQPAYINFYCIFTHIFACNLNKYMFFHQGKPSAGGMALPTGAKWQCHNTCGPAWIVDMKVILQYPFMTCIMNIFQWCLTHYYGRGCAGCSQSSRHQGYVLGQVKSSQQRLLGMILAFDSVGLQGWNLVGKCRVNGATVMHGCASMCLSVWFCEGLWVKGYIDEHDIYSFYCRVYQQEGACMIPGGRGLPNWSDVSYIKDKKQVLFKMPLFLLF